MESYDKPVYLVSGSFQSALKFQMSAVATMVLARKVRVSVTDPSGFVLQSLGQLNEKSNPGQQVANNSYERKFSSLAKQPEESLSNCKIFPTISNSGLHQALMLPNPGEPSTITCSLSYKSTDAPESRCVQVKSNSNQVSATSSQYILCNELQSKLSESVESSGNTANNAIMPTAHSTSDAQRSTESSQSSPNNIGYGILSRTRQFGAWLTKATEGGKVEITKQDLNALAPNSF